MKKIKNVMVFCMVFLVFFGFSMTTYAGGGEESGIITEEYEIEAMPLTPTGNLTLVDDIDGEYANNKQFVTVQSKAGNYFYLIIDRDGDTENVYFLNLVDEADLLALIEEEPEEELEEEVPETVPLVEEVIPQVEKEDSVVEEKSNSMVLGCFVVLIGFIGGGAYYYLKVLNPNNQKKTMNFDEYDFEDDDEEVILDEIQEGEYDEEIEEEID